MRIPPGLQLSFTLSESETFLFTGGISASEWFSECGAMEVSDGFFERRPLTERPPHPAAAFPLT